MDREDDGTFAERVVLSGEYKDIFEKYAGWKTAHTRKETTVTRLKAGAKAWLWWCEENGVDPFSAEEDDTRRYIDWMNGEDYAETTICRRFSSVQGFYIWIRTDPDVDVDLEVNPTANINLPRDYEIYNEAEYMRILDEEGRDEIIALNYEAIEPIFDHVPGKRTAIRLRNELICRLFWQTALRSDELSRVRVSNIEWEERDIRVRSSKLNRKKHRDLYHRHVWWEPNIDLLMRRWRNKRKEFVRDDGSPYLFIGERGGQLDSSYMSKIVKEAAHNAGVNEPMTRNPDASVKQWLYTAHRLRRSRITQLANDPINMNLDALRRMAGHVSFDTTLSYVEGDWGTTKNAYFDAVERQNY
jgi:integrase/recombinase XerD